MGRPRQKILFSALLVALLPFLAAPNPALALDPDGADHRQCEYQDEPAARIVTCTRLLADAALTPAESADLLLNRARAQYESKARDAALADVSEAIRLKPDEGLAYLFRGVLHAESRDAKAALADYSAAVALPATATEGRRARAALLLTGGRPGDALVDLDALLTADPDDTQALLERGIARWRSLKILTLSSASEQADNGFALLQNEFCTEGLEDCALATQALADLGRAIDLTSGPDRATALLNRALIESARRDTPGAFKDLDEAIRIDPARPVFRIRRATLRKQAGDLAAARADLDEALRLQPKNAEALVRRAELRADAGDSDGARSDVDAVLHLPSAAVAPWLDDASHLRRKLLRPGDPGSETELRDLGIVSAGPGPDRLRSGTIVIRLDPASIDRFAAFTTAHVGDRSQLLLGATVIAEPRLLSPILNGEIELSTTASLAETRTLIARLAAPDAKLTVRAMP